MYEVVKEDDILKPSKIVKWQKILEKLQKGERFSYDENK